MMRAFEFDLFVIGGGSGGVRSARMAAQLGVAVGLAEGGALGGTCVNVGCVPKKLYSYAAHYGEAFDEAAGYGWRLGQPPELDWSTLKRNRAGEISRLNRVYAGLLDTAGVRLFAGQAQVLDAHTVQVNGHTYTSRYILIATGGRPSLPDAAWRKHVISSDDVFDLPDFPSRLLVVGGGYIACEFASIFQGLGAGVIQVHRGEALLRGFDDDVRAFLESEMRAAGVDLRLANSVSGIVRRDERLEVRLADGNTVCVDAVLCATGRVPNTKGAGLEAAGVAMAHDGTIQVDEHYRTSVPSIYAIGDVSSRVQLTPVATAEAMVVVEHLFGEQQRRVDYTMVPTAVFTHPNIGTVGLTEAQARSLFGNVSIYRSSFRSLKHTLTGRPTRTLVKLVVDNATERVVGLHMVGEDAGEVVQGFAVALRAGATKTVFDTTLGVHPTVAEEFVTLREPVAH